MWDAKASPAKGSESARAARPHARNLALAAFWSDTCKNLCGAAKAVGVSSSLSLLVQVGTRYHDQDRDRASSRENAYRPSG